MADSKILSALLVLSSFAFAGLAGAGAPTIEEQLVEAINQERWINGQLPPFKGHNQLATAAENHSVAMANRNFFGHCDLDTLSSAGSRAATAGYTGGSIAENLAAGQGTVAGVVAGWMASSGHRNNILSNRRDTGTGFFFQAGDQNNVRVDLDGDCATDQISGPFGEYWTQVFGTRSSVYPVVIDREAWSTDSRNVELYLYGTGWAAEMRLRNESGAFGNWMSFSTILPWQLSAGGGLKEVFVELRNGAGTVRTASDTIRFEGGVSLFEDGFESGNTSAWTTTVQ
ncbi:MAG: CAP domain-containing protein [Acidobacteriota bacterium]